MLRAEGCLPSKCHCFHISGSFHGLGLVAVLDVRVRGTVRMFISAQGTDFNVNFPNPMLWTSLGESPFGLEFCTITKWFPIASFKSLKTEKPSEA